MAKDKALSQNPAQAFHKQQKRNAIKKAKSEKAASSRTRVQPQNKSNEQEHIDMLLTLKRNNRLNSHDAKLLRNLQSNRGTSSPALVSVSGHTGLSYNHGVTSATEPETRQAPGRMQRGRSSSESSSSTDRSVSVIPMPSGAAPSRFTTVEQTFEGAERSSCSIVASSPAHQEAETMYTAEPQLHDLRHKATMLIPSKVKQRLQTIKSPMVHTPEAETVRSPRVRPNIAP